METQPRTVYEIKGPKTLINPFNSLCNMTKLYRQPFKFPTKTYNIVMHIAFQSICSLYHPICLVRIPLY